MISSVRYLLDANALSEPTRVRPNRGVVDRIERHRAESATGAPAWHEMWFGARRLPPSAKRRQLEEYMDNIVAAGLPILPYDTAAADWHAAERARLTALGRTPPFVDGQLAAIAQTNGLVLVTANVADFRIFEGLRVEDWRS
jgi:tRNA(fMet)-specific endonuclease VapC